MQLELSNPTGSGSKWEVSIGKEVLKVPFSFTSFEAALFPTLPNMVV